MLPECFRLIRKQKSFQLRWSRSLINLSLRKAILGSWRIFFLKSYWQEPMPVALRLRVLPNWMFPVIWKPVFLFVLRKEMRALEWWRPMRLNSGLAMSLREPLPSQWLYWRRICPNRMRWLIWWRLRMAVWLPWYIATIALPIWMRGSICSRSIRIC